jgi:hypothetical protein
VTRVAAQSFKRVVRHRLFLWDNYPVNDGSPTMHLGPLSGRDEGLCEVVDGYLSNPMCSQNQINRLPLATAAEYAGDPHTYKPARAIGQAIVRLAKAAEGQAVLKELVEAYPGFIVAGGGTVTHHHAVGTDHVDGLAAEVGELGMRVLRAVKDTLDPTGILNPGKLVR